MIWHNAYSQGLSIANGQQFYDLDLEKGVERKHVEISVAKDGSFSMHLGQRANFGYSRCINYRINEKQDYSIEASISDKSFLRTGTGFGIVFGATDYENCWLFLISFNHFNRSYRIIRRINNMVVYDTSWKLSDHISMIQQNHLKIWKNGKNLLFAINGYAVESVAASELKGSQHGFYVGGSGTFNLHNFYIKEFESEYTSGSPNQTSASNSSNANANGMEPKIVGSGTGFDIDSRGYLVTNYHVTSEANALYVCLQKNGDWNSYYAKVIKDDPTNDLSIIKIEDPNFREFSNLPYSMSFDTEDIASDVFTLGYPQVHVMGIDVKYTTGVINAKTGIQGDPTHYQISAHIDHGNSGGPLFNSEGFIIGITDSGLDKATYGDVNYAIKSTYLKALADALPIKLYLPNDKSISEKKRTEQIKDLSPYVALILIAQ